MLFELEKLNNGLDLVKIQVDSLGFSNDSIILPDDMKYFKVVDKNKIKSYTRKITGQYYNGKEIINKINESLDMFNNVASFTGPPGTGKTYKIKNEYTYNYACTISNVCANNLNDENKDITGQTLYSFLYFHNPQQQSIQLSKYRGKKIWIDEFSMVPRYYYNFLYILVKVYKCQLILTGDIDQIPAINEKVIDLKNNLFFKKLFCNCVQLVKDYRNDSDLIALRNMILRENSHKLREYFKISEYTGDIFKIQRHLCFTHNTRRYINQKMLDDNGYKYQHHGTWLEVSPNVILQCRINYKSEGILKNDLWRVIKCDKKILSLKNVNNGNTMELNQIFGKFFTLGFCTTCHSAQGLTISEEFIIHEVDMMLRDNASKCILYTGVTRGKKRANVYTRCKNAYSNKSELGSIKYEESEDKNLDVDIYEYDEVIIVQ